MKTLQTILVLTILVGCSTSKNVRQFSEHIEKTGFFNSDSAGKRIVQSSAVKRDTASAVSLVDSSFDTEIIEQIREWFLAGGDLRKASDAGDTAMLADPKSLFRETTRKIRTRGSKAVTEVSQKQSSDSASMSIIDTAAKSKAATNKTVVAAEGREKDVRRWYMLHWSIYVLIALVLIAIVFRKKLYPDFFKNK